MVQKLGEMQSTFASLIAESVNTCDKLKDLESIVDVGQKRQNRKRSKPYIREKLGKSLDKITDSSFEYSSIKAENSAHCQENISIVTAITKSDINCDLISNLSTRMI